MENTLPAPTPQLAFGSVFQNLFRYFALIVISAFGIWFAVQLYSDGNLFLMAMVIAVTLMINIFFLRSDLYVYRWFAPGLALMFLMVAYPTIFTVYVAFTNYSDGHLLTKPQAIDIFERRLYLPEGGKTFEWTAFQSEADPTVYALWLIDEAGDGFLAVQDEAILPKGEGFDGLGALDADGIPESLAGYVRHGQAERFLDLSALSGVEYGVAPEVVQVSKIDEAAQLQRRYTYENDSNTVIDNETGIVYRSDEGTYTSEEGEALRPGYYVPIGLDNFDRLLTGPGIRGPFLRIFLWTFGYAIGAVFLTFWMGLGLALVLNHELVPHKKLLRSLILVPYAVPAFIGVLVWRGMLEPIFGVITVNMRDIFGWSPDWFGDPRCGQKSAFC